MRKYAITTDMIYSAINMPDKIIEGYGGRRIYQKKLNGHVLRVIVEGHKNVVYVITAYKARSVRYEI